MADLLVTQLAERLDVSPEIAQAALETFVDDIQADLALGETVTLPGIGTFRQDITGTLFAPDVSLTDAVNMSYSGLGNLSLNAGGGPISEVPSAHDLTDPTAYTLPDDDPADALPAPASLEELTEADQPDLLAPAPDTAPADEDDDEFDMATFEVNEPEDDEDDFDVTVFEDEPEDEPEDEEPGEVDLADATALGDDTALDEDEAELPQAEDVNSLDDLLLPDPFADDPMGEDDDEASDLDDALLSVTAEEDAETEADEDTFENAYEDDTVGTLEPIDMELEAVDAPDMEASDDEFGDDEFGDDEFGDDTGDDADDMQGLSFLDDEEDSNDAPDLSFLPGDDDEAVDTVDEDAPGLSFLPGDDDVPDAEAEDGSWSEPDDDEHPLGPASTAPMEEADFSVMSDLDASEEVDEPFDFIEGLGEPDDADDEADDFAFMDAPALEADEGLAPEPEPEPTLQPHPDIPSSATPRVSVSDEETFEEEEDRRPLFLIGALAMILVVVLAAVTYQFVIKEDPAPPVATETPANPNQGDDPETTGTEGETTAEGTVTDPNNTTTNPGPDASGRFTLPYLGGIDFEQGGWTVVVGSETLYSRAAVRAATFQRFSRPIEILQGQDNGGLTRYRIALGQFEGASAANEFKRQNAGELPADAWFLRIRPEMRYNPQ